jgi:hypothetical protein
MVEIRINKTDGIKINLDSLKMRIIIKMISRTGKAVTIIISSGSRSVKASNEISNTK